MNDELIKFYNNELHDLRNHTQSFANTYPKIASRLKLGQGHAEDPLVERLIESVAFLTARTRQVLQHEQEKLSENLVQLLYPHYFLPIPSCSTLTFSPAKSLDQSYTIPAKTVLSTAVQNGNTVNFTTVYPVTVYPVRLSALEYRREGVKNSDDPNHKVALSSLRCTLSTLNEKLNLADLGIETLRFFINGTGHISGKLLELLLARTQAVMLTSATQAVSASLPDGSLKPVGFMTDEALLPYPENSFAGYRYLTEFFAYPEKYHYVDLHHLNTVITPEWGNIVEITFYFSEHDAELTKLLNAQTLLLHATPVINLFAQTAEPIKFDHTRLEYPVIADAQVPPEIIEIYSVQTVNISSVRYKNIIDCAPYFGRRFYQNKPQYLYWYAQRESCERLGKLHLVGDEVFLKISDFNLENVAEQLLLTPQCLCTNRTAAEQLPYGGGQPKLQFRDRTHDAITTINCIKPITASRYRPIRAQHRAEIAEHIYLNHLGLSEPESVLDNLKQLLSIYAFPQDFNQNLIDQGLVEINVKSVMQRHPAKLRQGFCYGNSYQLTINETHFTEQQAYLLGMILYYFLIDLCAINRTVELHLFSQQRGLIAKWPAQIGNKKLL